VAAAPLGLKSVFSLSAMLLVKATYALLRFFVRAKSEDNITDHRGFRAQLRAEHQAGHPGIQHAF
jgi:hypothetical protein